MRQIKDLVNVSDGEAVIALIRDSLLLAIVSKEPGGFYLCQDYRSGMPSRHKKGMMYSWCVGDGSEYALNRNEVKVFYAGSPESISNESLDFDSLNALKSSFLMWKKNMNKIEVHARKSPMFFLADVQEKFERVMRSDISLKAKIVATINFMRYGVCTESLSGYYTGVRKYEFDISFLYRIMVTVDHGLSIMDIIKNLYRLDISMNDGDYVAPLLKRVYEFLRDGTSFREQHFWKMLCEDTLSIPSGPALFDLIRSLIKSPVVDYLEQSRERLMTLKKGAK